MLRTLFRQPAAPMIEVSPREQAQRQREMIRAWAQRSFGELLATPSMHGFSKHLDVRTPPGFRVEVGGQHGFGGHYDHAVEAVLELWPDLQVVSAYLGLMSPGELRRIDPARPVLQFELTRPFPTSATSGKAMLRFWPPEAARYTIARIVRS